MAEKRQKHTNTLPYTLRSLFTRLLHTTLWNLRLLRKNPRLIFCLLIGFLLCFFLTRHTLALSRQFQTDVQLLEPFIWCFSDSDSILLASLALLLLLSQMPRLDASDTMLLFRVGRKNWLTAQILTALVISLGYTIFLLLSSLLLTIGANISVANRWSRTATIISYAPETLERALTIVRKTVRFTKPYSCSFHIFWLLTQYTLFLLLTNLAVSLRFGKKAGISAVIFLHLTAWLLTPNRFMVWLALDEKMAYYANLLAAWLSPLQHATYIMHNFGYDSLPTLTQTHLLFGGLNLALLTAVFWQVKKLEF